MLILFYIAGPGVFIKVLMPRTWFSLTYFMAAALVFEAAVKFSNLYGPPSLPVASLAGAFLTAMVMALALNKPVAVFRAQAGKWLRPHGKPPRLQSGGWPMAVCSAFLGASGLLVLLAFLGQASTPWWPLDWPNNFMLADAQQKITRWSLLGWSLALTVWGIKAAVNKNAR